MGLTGRGQSWVYEAMADGRIKGVKSDGRTLVVVQSIHDYVAGLPPVCIKAQRRPPDPDLTATGKRRRKRS
jgi:hypothetical protein